MTFKISLRHVFSILCGLSLSSTGCDAVNGLVKVGDCEAGFLTSGEIMAMNASVRDVLAAEDPPVVIDLMTQDQAAAVATFLELNNAQCAEEIRALADLAGTDPDAVQGLDELAAAFEGTDNSFDPANVSQEDMDTIFHAAFGA